MTESDQLNWANYLINYTWVMAGCPGLDAPPPGGVRVFAVANTAAVGVARASLSSADVERLIGLYVPIFTGALALGADESAIVSAHLRASGAQAVVADAPAVCTSQGDAGG